MQKISINKLFIALSSIFFVSSAYAQNSNDIVNDWKKQAQGWSVDKEKAAKSKINSDSTSASKGKSVTAQNASAGLDAINKYGGQFGGSPAAIEKIGIATSAYKLYMNNDLLGQIYGEISDYLPAGFTSATSICYTKKKQNVGGDFADPCALIPDLNSLEICKKLPEIAGFEKVSAGELGDIFNANKYTGVASLAEYCNKKFNAKKENPKEKTSVTDKVMNADPVGGITNKRNESENAHVKDVVKNSDITSASSINNIKIIKPLPDGSTVETAPFGAIAGSEKPNAVAAKKYINDIATITALEGGTKADVEKILILVAKNPTRINTTFENDLQYEMAKKVIVSEIAKSNALVDNYSDILDKVESSMKNKAGKPDVETILKGAEKNYADRVKAWVDDTVAFNEAFNIKGIPSPTKDYINNAVRGSNNELIDRMALVTQIKEQINHEALELSKIIRQGEIKKREFRIDLKKTIIASTQFDMNAARIGAGLDPYPEGTEEEVMAAIAKKVATDAMAKEAADKLKLLSPF
ncbi:MAG: hypothetical protein WC665_05535 [Sulfurimonas sp.]|jgi:hypothetical protein